jgi:hypothetical protein
MCTIFGILVPGLLKKKCFCICKRDEMLLSMKQPILKIHSYGILASYSCNIAFSGIKFWGLPPLLLDLQTSKCPTLCKTTLKNVIHRYLKNIDCSSFDICTLLAPHLPRHFWLLFLLQPLMVLMR